MDELTITSAAGKRITFSPLGAAMTGIFVPDRTGALGDVWVDAGGSAGKTIGRYANRIAGGSFALDGTTYQLSINDGRNTLHGGADGFSKRTWTIGERAERAIAFALRSPDGDQGFPGTLECSVSYRWADADTLRIDYHATTDKPTVVNFTNHVYFNLTGVAGRSVAPFRLQIPASAYTPLDAESIPTGAIAAVDALRDFRSEREVGTVPFDCNFAIDAWDGALRHAATLSDPESGRTIVVETTQPGMQLFTGKPGAIALETQHFADAPHHANFPSTVLRPGETFRSSTIYRFGVRD